MHSDMLTILIKEISTREATKTISVLNYVAESKHNGMNLTCKAYNPRIRFDIVQDSIRINVHCK